MALSEPKDFKQLISLMHFELCHTTCVFLFCVLFFAFHPILGTIDLNFWLILS